MTNPILGLAPEDVSTLLTILQRYIPDEEVWAIGSRVRGTSRPFSDLDLVIVNQKPLLAPTRAELSYVLSESTLPVKVDLVEWARASQSFRDIILQKYFVLKTKANPKAG